jgi:type VI secretion system protein ImpG
MNSELLQYYEHELAFIQKMGAEFAQAYPKIAGRLVLENERCEDPHVERLIEAFALLAGRVHHKIDDEFPEITEALLDMLYPHYLRPIPSFSIAQFQLDPRQGNPSEAYRIKDETPLYTRSSSGGICTFQTCYPVVLWPIEILSASFVQATSLRPTLPDSGAVAAVRIEMRCAEGLTLSDLPNDFLRLFINGPGEVAYTLYELIFNNATSVLIRDLDRPSGKATLNREVIRPVGFSKSECVLEYPRRSFLGYRLLQEYFNYPAKFLFVDIADLARTAVPIGGHFELLIPISTFERFDRMQQLEQNVSGKTFQLGCAPIVNLFKRAADPIRIGHTSTEYQIIPDIDRQSSMEVYSVERVRSIDANAKAIREFAPFYSMRHSYTGESENAFWFATRRASTRQNDRGTEVYLRLVDPGFNPALPAGETLAVDVFCTNRDLPADLPISLEFGELETDSGAALRARCLIKPTATLRPPLRRGLQWRLISHLSLNYLSIAEEGTDALREILSLYNFSDSPSIRAQIDGIVSIASEPALARMITSNGAVFCTGTGVRIEFNEDQFVGSGVFLMASVLERFLALYSALNSFSQLTATTQQRKGDLNRWLPRAGEQILL